MQSIVLSTWDLDLMAKSQRISRQIYLLRTMASLDVDSLWIDPDAFLSWGVLSQAWRLQTFPELRLRDTIQERIDACIDCTKDNLLEEQHKREVEAKPPSTENEKENVGCESPPQQGPNENNSSEETQEAPTGVPNPMMAQENSNPPSEHSSISEDSRIKKGMKSRSGSRILLAPTGNLIFCTTFMLVSNTSFIAKDTADVSIITSIVNTEDLTRRYAASLNFLTIGTYAVEEDLTIAYHAETDVLAFGVSIHYTQNFQGGRLWRAGRLFICQLKAPDLVDDKPENACVPHVRVGLSKQ